MSVEPFNRLVKLAARAFYENYMKEDNQQKRGDNRGIAVVVLDALTKRQWVREEDFAKELKIHSKLLRKILRFFEEEKLVTRDHRKESAKGSKVFVAAVAAVNGDGQTSKEGEEKVKMHTHSYCALDYSQLYDVVRYRIMKMKKKLKDELDSRNTIQMYICPNCTRKYSAFDALNLVSLTDEYFHCEICNSELVAESDKLAAEEKGDGDDNARKRRKEKIKDMMQRMEEQLGPVVQQLALVKDLAIPDFGTLQAWEATAAARRNGQLDSVDANKSSQNPIYSGTPMPYLGETKVEVALSGIEAKQEGTQTETKPTQKVLPPWMIKEGMNLTKEQRGETSYNNNSSSDTKPEIVEDKKQMDSKEDEDKRLQDEYVKQYYEALARAQEEAVRKAQQVEDLFGSPETSAERNVGMKAKREEEDDVEWEEDDVNENNVGGSSYKLTADLNMEAKEESEDEGGDDDIDWEEG